MDNKQRINENTSKIEALAKKLESSTFADVRDTTATAGDVLSGKEFCGADGQKVSGTIETYTPSEVTENTTLQTAGKYVNGDIVVNVAGSGGDDHTIEDALLDGSLTGSYTNDRITEVKSYGFMRQKINNLNLPNVIKVGAYSFGYLEQQPMIEINLPKIESIYDTGCFMAENRQEDGIFVLRFKKLKSFGGQSVLQNRFNDLRIYSDTYFTPNIQSCSISDLNTQDKGFIFFPLNNNIIHSVNKSPSYKLLKVGYVKNLASNTSTISIKDDYLLNFNLYGNVDDFRLQQNEILDTTQSSGDYYFRNISELHVDNNTASNTSLSTSINCEVGDNLLACVIYRSEYSTPDGWEFVDATQGTSGTGTTQTMVVYKKVATSTTETLIATQSSSGRIYCTIINIRGRSNVDSVPSMNKLMDRNTKTSSFVKGDKSLFVFSNTVVGSSNELFTVDGERTLDYRTGENDRLLTVYTSCEPETMFTITVDNVDSEWSTLGIEVS